LLVSSLTTKYRDLKFLIDFGIPLLKYITPGIATSFALFVDKLPSKLVPFAKLNPMGYLIDTFNYMFVGAGEFAWMNLLYPFVFALVILFAGVIIFNQTERNFMDTV
jgi:lipopolysaccharide transport system permease protein